MDLRACFAVLLLAIGRYCMAGDHTMRLEDLLSPAKFATPPQLHAVDDYISEDGHFPLDSQAACYRAATGPRMVALLPAMGHSHENAWRPDESYAFAIGIVESGAPWAMQIDAGIKNGLAYARFQSQRPLERATLIHTAQTGFTGNLIWQQTPAALEREGENWHASAPLPKDTRAWFINLHCGRLTVSSDFQSIDP